VILVDANLLLYAYDRTSPVHEPARRWLQDVFSGKENVGLSWIAVLAFLRITTNPKIFKEPFSIEDAVEIVNDWFAQPSVSLVHPGDRHWPLFRKLLLEYRVQGPLVTDAHVATLALEHDIPIFTRDTDFDRFLGLRSVNPL
jgi:toxin-antitoxin system PIN domain toxin